MGKEKTKAKFPPSSPPGPVEEDDLEAALPASRALLAALEVRAQTRANAVAAEAAQAAEAEIEAGKSLHAKDANFASSVYGQQSNDPTLG